MTDILNKPYTGVPPSNSNSHEFLLNLPKKELFKIYNEFTGLTYTEKLKLWFERYGFNIEQYNFVYKRKQYTLSARPQKNNDQELIEYNKWFFEHLTYKNGDNDVMHLLGEQYDERNLKHNPYKYFYFDTCKNEFEKRFELVEPVNKKYCIEKELTDIQILRENEYIKDFWELYKVGKQPKWNDKYFTGNFVSFKKIGQTLARYEQFLNEKLQELENDKPENTPPETLKKLSHNFVLLHELGIIDFLQTRYKIDIRNFARLIAVILDKPEQTETIRKYIETVDFPDKDKNPRTRNTLKEVNKILFDLGLKNIEEVDID